MAVQVVDHHERLARGVGQRLGGRDPDQEGPDQPRALGDRDGADVVERQTGRRERLVHDRVDRAQVVARGDLGHHAAVGRVQLGLRGDDAGDHVPAGDDRGGGLVAGGLDREDGRAGHPLHVSSGPPPRHMMIASSLLSE